MLRACLAVVLMTCAVSPVLAQNGRAVVSTAATPESGARSNEATASTANDKAAPAGAYGHGTTPATSQGGGGDDESVLRMRVPKWNSFLPGMFR